MADFTYNLTTDRGKVRLLVPDRVESDHLFTDDEIDAFLLVEDAKIKSATALALETIASDIAMVDKVIKLLDLTTDGAKTSDALLKRAKLLRDQAVDDIDWEIIEYSDLTPFNNVEYHDKITSQENI